MCEILAPAGDAAAFEAALDVGADAIYLGLQDFSARKAAANFTVENLAQYTERAHVLGTKVYVALNTLVKDEELPAFFACARRAWDAGADALILQDAFLGKLLKEAYPAMELHLSTQAGVCNIYGARTAKRCGFSRVILARETPLADIRAIADEIQAECFVQGALCTCFSGQCYLSSVIGGNSGNRGFCKQPCRKKYSIDRAGFDTPAYRLSLSDLCMGEEVKQLVQAGVFSLKIEGRMRSAAYVAAAVRYYRGILGGDARPQDLSDLRRTYNRGGYTRGYAFGQDKNLISAEVQGHIGEKVGTVVREQGAFLAVRSAFAPREGDGFKLLRGGKEVGGGVWSAKYPRIPGGFALPKSTRGLVGDEVCLTNDTALSQRLAENRRTVQVSLSASLRAGAPIALTARGKFGEMSFTSEQPLAPAVGRPFTEEELRACFAKTDTYPFAVVWDSVQIEGNCFVVKSALNAFRRAVYAAIYRRMAGEREPLAPVPIALPASVRREKRERLAVIDRDFSAACYAKHKIDFAIFKPKNANDAAEIRSFLQLAQYYGWNTLLYLPAYAIGEDVELLSQWLPHFGGAYGEGVYALELCRERGIPLFAGTGMNIFNRISEGVLRSMGAAEVALSKELSLAEIARLGTDDFVLAGGSLKVMDLGHCPFGRSCRNCDRRFAYTLTDEAGRKFPLLRGELSRCRFELYNTVPLRGQVQGDRLFDFCALSERDKEAFLSGEAPAAYTGGALKNGIH